MSAWLELLARLNDEVTVLLEDVAHRLKGMGL